MTTLFIAMGLFYFGCLITFCISEYYRIDRENKRKEEERKFYDKYLS